MEYISYADYFKGLKLKSRKMEENITLNVPSGTTELVVRTGQAAAAVEPEKVELCGNIYAPGEFVTKRFEEVAKYKSKTHVVFDYEEALIELIVNEESPEFKQVVGRLYYTDALLEFGINQKKSFTVTALYKILRMKRAYFAVGTDHAALLGQLKAFEAKTEVEFKSLNDFKGSTALQKIQTCKTNLTYDFVLLMPIYKGTLSERFKVEIEFEPNDGSIICWLVSEDLAEKEIKIRDQIMEEQLDLFKDFVVIQK